MTRRPAFTRAQVTRAAQGALKAGLTVYRVEIDADGNIVVHCVPDAPDPTPQADDFEARLRAARGWVR